MEKRISTLDTIRVVAIFMILLCHFFLFSDLNSCIGRYFAGVGNMIFFLVSAFLYGTKYGGALQEIDYKQFVVGRIKKLGSPVWLFLIILILLYLVLGVRFSWFDAALNFLFLGYFGKLPGNGHLWFLTVLVACYAEMLLLLRYKAKVGAVPWVILAVSVLLVVSGERFGIPSGAFFTIGLYGFVFLKSRWFLQKSKSMTWWMAAMILALNVVCFFFEYKGLFQWSRSTHFLLTGLCGFSLFSLMLRFIPDKSNKVISFLGGISFEIYLVHHTLCAGPFVSVVRWPFGYFMNFIVLIVLSMVLAIVLKTAASMMVKKTALLFGKK